MARVLYVLFVTLLVGMARIANGQNDPQFSQYMFNPLFYNPAAAGSEGVSRFQLMHRTQWAGYQPTILDDGGGPGTQLFLYNMPLDKIKSGIGLFAMNDRLGPAINQAVQLSYAYRLTLKNGTLAVGVQAGLYNRGFDFGQFRPNEPDPLLQGGRVTKVKPDFGAGVYYNTVDYWVGLSAQHLTEPSFALVGNREVVPQARVAYLTAGYRLGIGYDLDVQPSVLVKYSPMGGQNSITGNLLATYRSQFWAGVGYRTGGMAVGNIGMSLLRNNAMRVGFAADISLAQVKRVTSPTSYEVLLSYNLPAIDARKKPIIRTPRFRY
ncbi:MAG: type IX secretion system membrane protein PorP/SprF [Cytophagales bacterium]|nr:MAG: type IX secretion system membrane protein PorP/SprF [Cytophagales bacterium]